MNILNSEATDEKGVADGFMLDLLQSMKRKNLETLEALDNLRILKEVSERLCVSQDDHLYSIVGKPDVFADRVSIESSFCLYGKNPQAARRLALDIYEKIGAWAFVSWDSLNMKDDFCWHDSGFKDLGKVLIWVEDYLMLSNSERQKILSILREPVLPTKPVFVLDIRASSQREVEKLLGSKLSVDDIEFVDVDRLVEKGIKHRSSLVNMLLSHQVFLAD